MRVKRVEIVFNLTMFLTMSSIFKITKGALPLAKPLTRMEGRHVPGEPRSISNRQQSLLFKSWGHKLGIIYHLLTWQQSQSK